ncbi:MAG: prepilin-type N-terminal cleavage/methylation domain-containing protein [Lachnospiraceae bacterium]|nr:prepilin-type N-terminal cleavage/methylation domain-containing protein [Lachnospiraceae bacterium]
MTYSFLREKLKLDNQGVTLVELLVSVAIMSIVMLIATNMIVNGATFFERQSTLVEIHDESTVISNYLSESIMEATAITVLFNGDEDGSGTDANQIPDSTNTTARLTGSGYLVLCDGTEDKGDKRVLVYDRENTSLYVYTIPKSDTTELDMLSTFDFSSSAALQAYLGSKPDLYLISRYVSEFSVEIPMGNVNVYDKTTRASSSELGVQDPVDITIKYRITHTNGRSFTRKFTMGVTCRNSLDYIQIYDTANSILNSYTVHSHK